MQGASQSCAAGLQSPARVELIWGAETAKDNLARLSTGCQLHWHVTDMLSYLRRSDAQEADFIIASFSMHHLTTADKLAVLREGRRCAAIAPCSCDANGFGPVRALWARRPA